MSLELTNRSPDLKRLQDEGYDIEILSGYLIVKDVPYVNSKKQVKLGTLVSELSLAGDIAAYNGNHVAMFRGEYPCDKDGVTLEKIRHSGVQQLAPNLRVDHSFSSKPTNNYKDYYEKMTSYIAIFLSHAQAIEPNATAQTGLITANDDDGVFNYPDTSSSRAGIGMVSNKLKLGKIAIIGVGGTGSYVLDLVTKTPVVEIHLFDKDEFLTHNAFRAPSAASLEELRTRPKKVIYLKELYSKMRRGIIAHDYHIDATNVFELKEMNFVFICMDASHAKKLIVDALEAFDVPFVDVGMGVNLIDDSLNGVIRATLNTPKKRDHFKRHVSFAESDNNDPYDSNIQIADLNALNAAIAVIKWKKLFGFYQDFENEYHCTYSIDCNGLINDEKT